MADETYPWRYKFKRKTTAQWVSLNPVLLAGEPGIEVLSDGSEKVKYGDGVKTWSQLSYASGGLGGPALSDAAPQALGGAAAAGTSPDASRRDHVHPMPSAAQVGAVALGDPALTNARAPLAHKATHTLGGSDALTPGDIGAEVAGAAAAAASGAAAALAAHQQAADPHPAYLTAAEGDAAYVAKGDPALSNARAPLAHKSTHATGGSDALSPGDIGAAAVGHSHAIGDVNQLEAQLAAINARLDAFRDAATFYVSKRISASDSNNGTSEGEPFLTIGAAVAAANAYVSANPGSRAKILVGPGRFVEASLPFRLKPNILAQGALQRGTIIEPAVGQELNGFWALDSGCMVVDFRFSGHQATGTSSTDSSVGTRAWAVRFNEQANGGQGVYLTASPYVKDCASITAEDDAGLAGSTSTGDTGGGVEVDGAKCKADSPIRSMVVYGFTQQNLGGPGCVVKNEAYAELVSFFGLFGTWHVQAETGGQATLSGGGCSEFGIYGLVADGYSVSALFTGTLRVAASAGATTVDVVSMTANRLGTSSRPAAGQVLLLSDAAYVIQSSVPITSGGSVVADSDPTRAGYRVNFYNPTGVGLVANVAQGVTADFRQRSQISAGCHSANYVGSGTNYSALPWNGGVPIRANEAVERNLGRVFGLIVNDVGDVKVAGGAFAVDGTTGAVTINTSQFNLSGLNAIGPFSRNGGISTVGVQLLEISNNTSLIASTGTSDGNTAPTQSAVVGYIQSLFGNVNNTSDLAKPISTATQQALDAKISTSDSRLTDSREWSAATVEQSEAEAGTATTRRAWTAQRIFQAIAAWWNGSAAKTKLDGIANGATANSSDSFLLNRANHTGTQSSSTITDLGTAASAATTDFVSATANRTAAQVFAGPASGAATPGAFRALVSTDLPAAQTALAVTVTAASNVYTLDLSAANHFIASAAINANTTINLSNINAVASGRVQIIIFQVTYTSGALTFFSGNAGYTSKRQGAVPFSAGDYFMTILVTGGSTVIYYSFGSVYS